MTASTPAETINRRTLHPAIEPFNTGMLAVSEVHSIYFEECGNPEGKPVVCLHGGPGTGCSTTMRRFFDPSSYRIVLFDQRGCGRSKPLANIEDNTTWHSVGDIETLRNHLGINTWQVFGGSWGSALALAYAETHPIRCSELVLRGLFTLRRSELLWFYQEGANQIFPDLWENYVAPIPEEERGDMMLAYYRRLTGEDKEKQLECARAWSLWEGSTLSIWPDLERRENHLDSNFALSFARIECHYFVNGGFFAPDDQLIRNLGKIKHIPTILIQGRYDVCTPAQTAWDVHQAWPEADYRLVHDAGHTATEPGIAHELLEATDRFRS